MLSISIKCIKRPNQVSNFQLTFFYYLSVVILHIYCWKFRSSKILYQHCLKILNILYGITNDLFHQSFFNIIQLLQHKFTWSHKSFSIINQKAEKLFFHLYLKRIFRVHCLVAFLVWGVTSNSIQYLFYFRES